MDKDARPPPVPADPLPGRVRIGDNILGHMFTMNRSRARAKIINTSRRHVTDRELPRTSASTALGQRRTRATEHRPVAVEPAAESRQRRPASSASCQAMKRGDSSLLHYLFFTTIRTMSSRAGQGVAVGAITDVPGDAYAKVQLLSNAWGISAGEVVSRLVEHFANSSRDNHTEKEQAAGTVAIYVVYEATRIDAFFDPATKAVTITSGKLKDKVYATPSGAAVAVVSTYNPTINPNRNGWSFWFLAENGKLLQTIRR